MKLLRILNSNCPEFEQAYAIYEASFPLAERRQLPAQLKALTDPDYYFQVILNQQNIILGILLTWQTKQFVFIEHLAISEASRGLNIGSRIMELVIASTNLPIILEIEPPIDDISRRRQNFYTKLGFSINPYHHIQPPINAQSQPLQLKILSLPAINQQEYQLFNQYYQLRIMKYI